MKQLPVVVLLFLSIVSNAQNVIEWDGTYQLQVSDFQSPATEIGQVNIYSLRSGSSFEFSFFMSNAEFMFTKNFNSKVTCSFRRDGALLVAPDSATANDLVKFARYEFDLSELYARKFRKELLERKGAFSDANFYQPIYEEIQSEHAKRHSMAGKVTDLGRDNEKLKEIHAEVLGEIAELKDFCKTCKPPKRK